MRDASKRERYPSDLLAGWTMAPLDYAKANPGVSVATIDYGRYRLPSHFGGWWTERTTDPATGSRRATGREVELWLRAEGESLEVDTVTFKAIESGFDQLLAAMRDQLVEIVSVLDGEAVAHLSASMVNRTPRSQRSQAAADQRRRRRANAVDRSDVARLYLEGGAERVAEVGGVSMATAYRRVKEARAAGLLPPRGES